MAMTLNYIVYQISLIIIKKLRFSKKKIQYFSKAHKGNFFPFLILGMSLVTILYTQPNSYTFHISQKIAIFGPITVFIIGIIMFSANIFFNLKLIKKLKYLNIDNI
jgi:hypothetical protein